MQFPEPQITDSSFVQFAAFLVASLGTETLQIPTWTLPEGWHRPSAPCSSAQLQLPSLHRYSTHWPAQECSHLSRDLPFRKCAPTGSLESLLPLQNTLGPAFRSWSGSIIHANKGYVEQWEKLEKIGVEEHTAADGAEPPQCLSINEVRSSRA